MAKEKIEYFCPNCKMVVDFDETTGEVLGGPGFIAGVLRNQVWPKTSRYHIKCGQHIVELKNKKV